jgi:CRP-like cAMP-binding protein
MKVSSVDLLEELDKPRYQPLRQMLRLRRVARKTVVFEPMSPENLVFIVRSGRVRVYLSYEEKEFCLAVLGPGDVYSTHTRAFVQAIEDAELLVAPADQFRRRMEDFPGLYTTMIRVLGSLLGRALTIIDSLAFKKVGNRLLELLAHEAAHGRALPEGGVLLEWNLTTEQLAGTLGTTRQTLSSLMNSLSREGIVELRGKGSIYIADTAKLAHPPKAWSEVRRCSRRRRMRLE